MTKASDNVFPRFLISEGGSTATPAVGRVTVYAKANGLLYQKDDAGTETPLAGTVGTDSIWDAAGDIVVGSGADTAARLAKGAAGAYLSTYNGVVAWNGGTAFPASPATGDRFWRSDINAEFRFDGTRWLSATLHHIITHVHNISATAIYAAPSTTLGSIMQAPVPWTSGGSDIYLTQIVTKFLVSGGTALDASNKWVVTFNKRPTGNTNTLISTITIDAGSSNVWREDNQSIAALVNNGTTHYIFAWVPTITGTPGALFAYFDLAYRIVAT